MMSTSGSIPAVRSLTRSCQRTTTALPLDKIQLGEADAGVICTTDVTEDLAGDVTVIEIPQPVNVIARYPIAPVAGGDEALAAAFIAYVLGPEGQATLESYGFKPRP